MWLLKIFQKPKFKYFVSFVFKDEGATGYGNAVVQVDQKIKSSTALNLLTHNIAKDLKKSEIIILNLSLL